jgi:hypothetical protein
MVALGGSNGRHLLALLVLLACGVSSAIQKESQSCPAIVGGRWRGWITSKGK